MTTTDKKNQLQAGTIKNRGVVGKLKFRPPIWKKVTLNRENDANREAENIKELADIQAINILSQGLPRHIFNTLNQTETAQEIWENVELLMQGSGLTEQQQKEILFDQYERFRANGNESIHDYFVRFHKLINDMKITKIQILAHQRNTKFLNNLPSYWSNYEQHAMKTLSKMNQSSGNTDPLAYMAQATKTSSHTSSQQYSPSVPPQSPQSTNDAMLATMNQIRLKLFWHMWSLPKYTKAPIFIMLEPLAITTTTAFEVSHEDAYDSDVDEAPHAAAAFMANLTGTSTGEGTSNDTDFHSEDLHKTALGRSNPKYLKTAQLSRPALYRGDIVVNPLHTPHRVHDNEDTLVHAEVSRTKMLEKMKDPECPIISSPINYAKLNNLYDTFVPQKELTREQAYWLPANEVASNQSKPAQQFVHTRPAKSIEDNLFKEVSEYMKIFDELDKEYDQCVIDKKCLEIENKNLLIQNECLLAESISKDICSVVLTPDNLKEQLQGKDNIIGKLKAQINNMKDVSTGPSLSTLEIENTKSKEELTAVRIKNDSLQDENVSIKEMVFKNVIQSSFGICDQLLKHNDTVDPSKSSINYVEKFIGTVRFGNDQFAAIVGYGDYKIGDTIITRVYYVEGLSHNLFSVGQFCDRDLEVAFRKNTCFIHCLESTSSFLLSKASSTKSWLWHRRLNHLNFGTLNELARKDLVRGLPKLKYEKEHLCPSCQLGKSKKSSHPLKTVNTNTEILNTLHMDLCGPMRVESINGKKYILVVVDDYTRFGWVRFLRTKDETPEVIKKFIILTQRALNATVRYLRTDNGTEFVNKTLTEFCESVGITHNTSVPRTPQQNGVVERRNRTLMEAARTMLIFAKAPMFLWTEAIATACYTLNRSLIHTLHGKTYYELLKGKKPEVNYFRVFGSLCYPTNDYDDLGKLKAKADIGLRLNSMAPEHINAGSDVNHYSQDKWVRTSNQPPQTPSFPLIEKQLSELFQPLYDEDEEFPPKVQPQLVYVAPPCAPEIAPDSPSMTRVTEDAPTATTITSPLPSSPPDTSVDELENTITTPGSDSIRNSVTYELGFRSIIFRHCQCRHYSPKQPTFRTCAKVD
ncbi:retrovirus-related pol polyprotein from transposon TNT 1-94 [Tanacetum coccineum]